MNGLPPGDADAEPESSHEALHSGWRDGLTVAVHVGVTPSEATPDALLRLADAALQAVASHGIALDGIGRVEFDASFVSADESRRLNAEWRDRDRPTNVLSFPSGLPPLPHDDGQAMLSLGDVVACPEVIEREAREQGKPLAHHYAHMLVHSLLHLLGLDHEDDRQADAMEALEIRILSTLDIPDPYATDDAR